MHFSSRAFAATTVDGQVLSSVLVLVKALASTGGVLRDGTKGAGQDDLGSVSPLLQQLLHDVTSSEVMTHGRGVAY
jgi:hypothetical protein